MDLTPSDRVGALLRQLTYDLEPAAMVPGFIKYYQAFAELRRLFFG
jgi:hypothetical protein